MRNSTIYLKLTRPRRGEAVITVWNSPLPGLEDDVVPRGGRWADRCGAPRRLKGAQPPRAKGPRYAVFHIFFVLHAIFGMRVSVGNRKSC